MELYLNIFANLLGFVAIILSTWAFIISKRESTYNDLDSGYNEILMIGIEHPKFRNTKYTKNYKNSFENEDDLIGYENYAFLSLNLCETIFDRAAKDKKLINTWMPAIKNEIKIHKSWFTNTENNDLYKIEFKEFISQLH